MEFKKKGKAGRRGLTGLEQAERAARNKEQAKQYKKRQKNRQWLAVGVREELEIFKSIESLNAPPASTAPGRLQCLPRDLPRAAAKKRKRQSPTSPTASGKPAKKSLSNNSVILRGSLPIAPTSRVEPEQESMLSNIFVRPLGSPSTITSSSQDFDDFDDSDDSLTQLNTQDIDFRSSQFELGEEVDAAQTETQATVILPIRT